MNRSSRPDGRPNSQDDEIGVNLGGHSKNRGRNLAELDPITYVQFFGVLSHDPREFFLDPLLDALGIQLHGFVRVLNHVEHRELRPLLLGEHSRKFNGRMGLRRQVAGSKNAVTAADFPVLSDMRTNRKHGDRRMPEYLLRHRP